MLRLNISYTHCARFLPRHIDFQKKTKGGNKDMDNTQKPRRNYSVITGILVAILMFVLIYFLVTGFNRPAVVSEGNFKKFIEKTIESYF